MLERDVEKYLVKQVEALGGLCWKWAGRVGVPDRVVMLPDGSVLFVEVKTKGGKLSKMQNVVHRKMSEIGHDVYVVWSKKDVDELLTDLSAKKIVR